MRELSEASGLAKTTIHHYIREGLLPPVTKSARNAAVYGPEHLERLRLISQLRAEAGGELSIPQVRTVLAHSERGMGVEAATRLTAAGIEPGTAEEGLSPDVVRVLEAAGLIEAGGADGLSAGDLLVTRACGTLLEAGMQPEDLTPLADLLREVGIYARSLATLYAAQADAGFADPSRGETELSARIRDLLDALLWRALET